VTGVENGNSGSGRGIKSSLGQGCTWTEDKVFAAINTTLRNLMEALQFVEF